MRTCTRFVVIALFCLAIFVWADEIPRDHFKSATSATTFPVQIHQGLVYVPVEISGRHLTFACDTGSSRTFVDAARLKELQLKVTGGDSVQGAGQGRVSAQTVEGLAIHLHGLDVYFDQASSVDLSHLNNEDGAPAMDGILAYPLLSRYVVTIDYERQSMTITAPEKFVAPAGIAPLTIEIRHGWPFVAGELKPSEDVTLQDRFLIDSGSSDSVDHPVATKMQFRKPTETGVGLGTATTGTVAKLWGFRLGPYLVRDVAVACCGSTEDTMRMLGGEILSHFTVTFDYPHGRMFLVPNQRYEGQAN
jgi:hypothetical protein